MKEIADVQKKTTAETIGQKSSCSDKDQKKTFLRMLLAKRIEESIFWKV